MDTATTPLTVGGCLGDAFNHISKQWRAWLGSALVYFGGVFGMVFVLVVPLAVVGVFGVAFISAASGGEPDDTMMMLMLAPLVLFGFVFWLAIVYIGAIAPLGMARLALLALRGEPTSYWEVFHYARSPGTAIALFFLNLLITLPLLCLGIVPGIDLRLRRGLRALPHRRSGPRRPGGDSGLHRAVPLVLGGLAAAVARHHRAHLHPEQRPGHRLLRDDAHPVGGLGHRVPSAHRADGRGPR
jgi:hypothetical protein